MLSERLLDRAFGSFVIFGCIIVEYPSGKRRSYGQGDERSAFKIYNERTVRQLLFNPDLAFGEAYMRDDIVVTGGSIYDLIAIFFQNIARHQKTSLDLIGPGLYQLWQKIRGVNSINRSMRNVRRHYDLDERLYRLFLDEDMQYSCAYFEEESEPLDKAQMAKKEHIITKLNLQDSGRILDIGCGWGGLALSIARSNPSVSIVGVTLSVRQLEVARMRAQRDKLSDRVEFRLQDYRQIEEKFDRIVSVGMFEHVGPRDYDGFFSKVRDLLKPSGVALLHTIGRTGTPAPTSPWIHKYIFPGGHLPALSEILPAIEKSLLITSDVETLRLHYAKTLRHWRERFAEKRDAAQALYDEEFCRMWELYLAGSEASFRFFDLVVFQIQILASLEATPIVRDYMFPESASSDKAIAA